MTYFLACKLGWFRSVLGNFANSSYLRGGAEWHVRIQPAIALSLFAAVFYLVSRGLNEVADPRL